MDEGLFDYIIHNFDEFMLANGYCTTEHAGKVLFAAPSTIRVWIYRGKLKGTIKVADKLYIPVTSLKEVS